VKKNFDNYTNISPAEYEVNEWSQAGMLMEIQSWTVFRYWTFGKFPGWL